MRIRFVTSNEGKYNEVREALEGRGHELERSALTYPEIQSASLDEVVAEGLRWLGERLDAGEPFMIEDSGLFITALRGFPGVFSAHAYKTLGNAGILKLMEGVGLREAVFESRIGLRLPGPTTRVFGGTCKGAIAPEARGEAGFGFDPVFIPEGEERTFAQMGTPEKNALSHRGRALSRFVEFLAHR